MKLAPLPPAVRRLAREERATDRAAPPLPEIIVEGERDELLTSLAGSARRRGASEEAILALLRVTNDERCQPPLGDRDLAKIARSIGKKPPLPLDLSQAINDLTLARRFARLESAELRYCPAWRKWLVWDGTRWALDDSHEVQRRIKAMVEGVLELVATAPGSKKERDERFKNATRYTQRKKLDDVLVVAQSEEPFIVLPDHFDADPWLLNVENGTLDLRAGRLRRHEPRNLITKLAPVEYDPHAKAPRWERFLREVTKDDAEMQAFLQYAVGYTLTGETSEECLFFTFGPGKNGKTTFIETVRALLGEDDGYAQQIPFNVLLSDERGSNAHDTHRARTYRTRLVTAMEAAKGRAFNAALINQLTSNDRQIARRLYEMPFEFSPTHKLWVAANHKPPVREQTEGFWRRMRLVPFTFTVPKARRDKRLNRRLRAELPGILNWALDGCLAWQRHGLPEPKRVEQATKTYRQENDPLRDFVEEECRIGEGRWTPTNELYERFKLWWPNAHGDRTTPPSRFTFGSWLRERRDVRSKKQKGERGWDGIALRSENGHGPVDT
jgi:putative DNA primase/helicase